MHDGLTKFLDWLKPKKPCLLHEIRILTSAKALEIQPFLIPQNQLEIGRAWKEWLEDFEEETEYFEIKNNRDKVSALKIYGGPEMG